jgi:hypothetical protein
VPVSGSGNKSVIDETYFPGNWHPVPGNNDHELSSLKLRVPW